MCGIRNCALFLISFLNINFATKDLILSAWLLGPFLLEGRVCSWVQVDIPSNRSKFRQVYIPTVCYSDINILAKEKINSYCRDE